MARGTKKGDFIMKTKAMVLVKPGRMEIQEFDVGDPKPDQILVRTGVTSVCASDFKWLLLNLRVTYAA